MFIIFCGKIQFNVLDILNNYYLRMRMISRVILIKDNVILLIIQTAKLHGDCSKSDGLLFLIRATVLSPDWLLSKYYLYANENLKSRCTCDTESDVSL